jgi:hypothetical protein
MGVIDRIWGSWGVGSSSIRGFRLLVGFGEGFLF